MVILQKNLPDGIIGEVPLTLEVGGPEIGTAKLEKIGSRVIMHVDAADIPEAIIGGFSMGDISIYDEVSDPVMPDYDMDAEKTMEKFRQKLRGTFDGE